LNLFRIFLFGVLLLAGAGGYLLGNKHRPIPLSAIQSAEEFPLTEYKTFAIIVYACNQASWCEKALRSLFEQDYDHYRVVLIDDASNDGTFEKTQDYIVENNQEHRVILIRNETRIGPIGSLYRAIGSCLDREIALPLDAKDWLAHPGVLTRLNRIYQNPEVWFACGQGIQYPSYSTIEPLNLNAACSFYAGLMKQIRLDDLYKDGRFIASKEAYLIPLRQMAGRRLCALSEPFAFSNTAACFKQTEAPHQISQISRYEPLAEFPQLSR